MNLNPKRIPGPWDDGFSLDFHTIRSEFLGHDEYGHLHFDTERSELGELLYRLKYKGDDAAIKPIADAVAEFLPGTGWAIDLIVPVPPSKNRKVQPLHQIAEKIGEILKLPVVKDSVRKDKPTPELKDEFDYSKRMELLEGAFSVERGVLEGRRILLFDDLFRSGATLNAVARVLKNESGAEAFFALTLTRTRSLR